MTPAAKRKKYGQFMRYTLAPALRERGQHAAANDAVECGKLLTRGRKDGNFATFLQTYRVPKLKEHGQRSDAAHFLRCVRVIRRR